MNDLPWHNLEVEEIIRRLQTDVESGLPTKAAEKRLKQGKNILRGSRKKNPFLMLLSQFTDTMVLVLLGATVLSGILGDTVDAVTILMIVLLNGLLGFIQEYRAERSLEAIKKLASPFAQVIRDGRRQKIPAENLVGGDIVLLESGDRVPADIRLTETSSLEIEESCLTGESVPVVKDSKFRSDKMVPLGDRKNMAFMGTTVTRGRGRGIVVATGMSSAMGEIARIIDEEGEDITPLQHRLNNLGKVLILICTGACIAVMALGLWRGENPVRMLMAGISLAVAAIPEGLPAIVTVVLALGVQRMARLNAIVRRLPAVETLGCTSVICSDKTGTLTQNQMTVQRIAAAGREYFVTGEGFNPQGYFLDENGRKIKPLEDKLLKQILNIGYFCNNSELVREGKYWSVYGDPTEGALLVTGMKAGLEKNQPVLREIPFDSERKMMSVIVKHEGRYMVYAKGALEAIMPRCAKLLTDKGAVVLDAAYRKRFEKLTNEWAGEAFRVLAFACREVSQKELELYSDEAIEQGLSLAGICGMIDPPRLSAVAAVEECRRAGIIPVMITGDHPATARAIADQIGIQSEQEVIGPEEIDRLSPKALAARALSARVFARVSPQHKLKIVKALKNQGHVVAMTGDGVNDAPALKEADIGVAMGLTGTEVAKEASAMILADDDFSTIVAAVHEGRAIYDNVRKFIRYLLGCNIGEILTMLLATIIGIPLPMLPIQMLWVNLVTDGLPAMALGLEPPEPGVMKRKPRSAKESVFSRGLGWKIARRGVLVGLSTLALFSIGLIYSQWTGKQDLAMARTMTFCGLVFAQLFFVFECRSEVLSPFQLGFMKNRYLVAAVLCSTCMQIMVVYLPMFRPVFGTVPLDLWQWILILSITGARFFLKMIQYWVGKLAGDWGLYDKLVNNEVFSR